MTTTPLSTIELETGFLRRDGNPVAADLIDALAAERDELERLAGDMETAMSETTPLSGPTPRPWRAEMGGITAGMTPLAYSPYVASYVSDVDADLIVRVVNALSALGDPVVVAEVLPELVDAAKGIERLMAREGENSLEHFERIAAMFYRDTGMLMPGKDAGLLPGPTEEERLEAYEAWREKPANHLRSVLSKLKAQP